MKKIITFCLLAISLSCFAMTPKPGDQVFRLSASVKDPNTIALTWHILPGYYLYRDRLHFSVAKRKQATLGRVIFPSGEKKFDSELGHYEIYRNKLDLSLPVLGEKQGDVDIIVRYQGCADSGFCYPPMAQKLRVHFSHELAARDVTLIQYDMTKTRLSEMAKTQQLLASHNIWLVLAGFFGFGLLLAFTPCVLPMVPILSGIIVGHGKDITTRKAFLLSLTYVLSMSFTYAAAGLVIALLGANIQSALQSPSVIISFAILFFLLALSMFGLYDLRLPTKVQQKFASLSQRQSSGSYLGVFIMGTLSTLILSPCVTPPLVGTLGYIATTGNVFFGALALFSLGLGMGFPLILIGTSGGKLLPKAGIWMNAVKYFFGVMMIAVAILLLDRILPGNITLMLWAILFVTVAVFMGAFRRLPETPRLKLSKAIGILLLIYGILCLIGGSMGHDDLLAPLGEQTQTSAQTQIHQQNVHTVKEAKRAIVAARGKPVIIDFYADWCLACKVMERTTFKDESVKRALGQFVFLKVDVTQNNAADKQLLNHFKVIAPPTFIFIDREGNEVSEYRVVGEMNAKDFLLHLNRFLHQSH